MIEHVPGPEDGGIETGFADRRCMAGAGMRHPCKLDERPIALRAAHHENAERIHAV